MVLLSLGVSEDVSKLSGGSNVALVSSYCLYMSSAAKISKWYEHAANVYKENGQQNKFWKPEREIPANRERSYNVLVQC